MATSVETIAKKRRVLVGFFRYAVARCRLKASPMPSFERKRGAASFTPYIFSETELKQLLAAAPAASGPRSEIDADTLRTFVLLLYGAGLRRGEARRLKVSDVDLPRSLLHIRGTKFFKTRIVPISAGLSAALKTFVATGPLRDGGDLLFCKRDAPGDRDRDDLDRGRQRIDRPGHHLPPLPASKSAGRNTLRRRFRP